MTNKIPDGWEEKRLDDLCTDIAHINPMKNPDEEFEYIDVSSVSNESFKIMNTTRYDGRNAPSRAQKIICSNDVLYSTVRPSLRHIAFVPKNLHGQICSTAFCVLRANQTKIEPNYLYQLMITEELNNRITKYEQGSNYPAVLDSDIFKQIVIIPKSLKEQQKIAQILLTVDNAIEKTRALIEKDRMMKRGLMRDLFTRGLDENGKPHTEFKDTELGKIPKSWDFLVLSDEKVSQLVTDGSHFSPSPVKETNLLIATVKDMADSRIDFNSCAHISYKDFTRLKNEGNLIKQNDVLLSKDGTIGRVMVYKQQKEIMILSSIAMIRPSEVNPDFIGYAMKSNYFVKQIFELQSGSALKRIVLRDIKKFKVPIPKSKREQEKIASILLTVDNNIENETFNLNKLIKLKAGLMRDLLTGEVRVKVGG